MERGKSADASEDRMAAGDLWIKGAGTMTPFSQALATADNTARSATTGCLRRFFRERYNRVTNAS